MQPPVQFQDRSDYKRRMNALPELDPRRTAVLTIDMQNDALGGVGDDDGRGER